MPPPQSGPNNQKSRSGGGGMAFKMLLTLLVAGLLYSTIFSSPVAVAPPVVQTRPAVAVSTAAATATGAAAKMAESSKPESSLAATTSSSSPPPKPPAFFKKTSGEKWHVWDPSRDGILFRDELSASTTCDWAKFIPNAMPGLPPPIVDSVQMCVYQGRENDMYVSDSIRQHGRWGECDALSNLVYKNGNELHLEIGANIGSCVLQILLTTNATIVAFEPAPTNLFVLTSTLMGLQPHLRNRVFLFPIGLGDIALQSTINIDANNRGNSIVGNKGAVGAQLFLPPMPISVERLDDILDWTKLPPRDLINRRGGFSCIKIDVQGYECGVVRGMMPATLQAAHIVMYENDESFLEKSVSTCSSSILYDLFTKSVDNGGAGFVIRLFEGHKEIGDKLDAFSIVVQDLLAMPKDSTFSAL